MNQPMSAGDDGDDGAGPERVDHERELEQLADVGRRSQVSAGPVAAMVSGGDRVVGGRLGLADDDEPAVGGPQHLDRRAVQAVQRRRR